MMRLYFVRHGESEANTLGIIANRSEQLGRTKRYHYGLTPTGRRQALALTQTLQPYPISAILTSPLRRAQETAEILAQALGLPYQITDALREYDCGVLEGQSDPASWQLHQAIVRDWQLNRQWDRHPDQGESFLDIRKRFLPFIQSLRSEGASAEAHYLLVSHGGLLQLMLPLLLVNIEPAFAFNQGIGHAECIIAELQADGFRCLQWGEIDI